jgi:hypothetical protein
MKNELQDTYETIAFLARLHVGKPADTVVMFANDFRGNPCNLTVGHLRKAAKALYPLAQLPDINITVDGRTLNAQLNEAEALVKQMGAR